MNQILCLNDMNPGDKAQIKELKINGSMRRRLLDIGFIEGTQIECVGKSPGGDPAAYKIREAVIAIRSEEGSGILIDCRKQKPELGRFKTIAVAGNPNVGKSTVFNILTGMKQHTGNWPGKTVACAEGMCKTEKYCYHVTDLPGTYSIMAHSAEEEVARNYLCFEKPDITLVVCNASCLERNLNLALQIMELTHHVIICVNMMDEAARKKIHINLKLLSEKLKVPVVGIAARKNKGITELKKELDRIVDKEESAVWTVPPVRYGSTIESAISLIEPVLEGKTEPFSNSRWLSLKLLEKDLELWEDINNYTGHNIFENSIVVKAMQQAEDLLKENALTGEMIKDEIVSAIYLSAEAIGKETVSYQNSACNEKDRRLDKILTSKWSGYPIMLLLLAFVLWLTMWGSNYLSQWLSMGLFKIQDLLTMIFVRLNVPEFIYGAAVLGVYRVTAWVISVMLPPMAIFFPLFTLLEDSGYLPRIAYNLDLPFKKCKACGKQALTMCME